MQRSLKSYGMVFSCVAGLLLGCGTPASEVEATPAASPPSPIASANADSDATMTGMQTYDEPQMAIATKYPQNMTAEGACSGEGCGYFFKFQPQNNALDAAEVHVFLPAGATTAAEVEQFVTGPNSFMTSNGWTAVQEATPPQELFYPWVKKVITFSTDQEMMGEILLGETNGQGLRVTLLYPAEMSDAYWPAAKAILDNLTFKANLLPIGQSTAAGFQGEDSATMCDPATEPC